MNRLLQISFKYMTVLLFLAVAGVYGQKQTKTYEETFNVGDNAVLDINTSHADIQFETWGKDQVQIEAVIELEGASKEEAEAYFKKGGIKIVGNSREITISTGSENSWHFSSSLTDLDNIHIEIPDFPDLEPLFLDLQLPELSKIPNVSPMPPMPPVPPVQSFNYGKYKKEGEKYLEEWKKEFDKSFDKDYKKRLEEWSERVNERVQERKERLEERNQERKKHLEERSQEREERVQEHKLRMVKRKKVVEEHKKAMKEHNEVKRSFIISRNGDEPNVFYRSFDGANKKYKVKKTIKIKMPKSVKLKINVRHGEVKLAENTRNINATLSYARLLAATIEGDKTNIMASYSPVSVQKWNYGKLRTDYSEKVDLKEVRNLRLNSISSAITIDRLLDNAHLTTNLGNLVINSVSNDFADLEVFVSNGELKCRLPTSDFTIYVTANKSDIDYPSNLNMKVNKDHLTTFYKGYHKQKNENKVILINSKFSDIVLEQ